MSKVKNPRKARLKAAAALAGVRLGDVARLSGVSPQHLSEVLQGRRKPSERLLQRLDSFIAKHLPLQGAA